MHILNRAAGEQILIGQDITVRIIAVRGNSIRLGVEAPKDVSVHRLEVYERIKDQRPGTLLIPPRPKD